MTKLTVTFPDGTKGSRRTPRAYTHVIASRLDKPRRPDKDRVTNAWSICAEGKAVMEPFEREIAAAALGIGWDKFWFEMDARRTPVVEAHKATCPKGCDGRGGIRTEISRKPEPTGWRVISWHHSLDLAHKARNTRTVAYATEGHDEVRIFPVDGTEGT